MTLPNLNVVWLVVMLWRPVGPSQRPYFGSQFVKIIYNTKSSIPSSKGGFFLKESYVMFVNMQKKIVCP